MRNKKFDLPKKAKEYAFLLLKFRPRSNKEIYWRLKKKGFQERVINATILFLEEKGFINDTCFTQAWIESRLKKSYGLRRIEVELRTKGINKEIIDQQIGEIKKDYSEKNIIAKIIKEKLFRIKGIEPLKAKRRVFSYLCRRGFSSETIIDAIEQL